MPELLCDPREWQDAPLIQTMEQVHTRIPQRHEMALLHGILHHDREGRLAIGMHQSRPTDFWVRGHVPGRPLMPGVVMVEIAAQLSAWAASFELETASDRMFGFVGIDGARFRGQVAPGERLIVASHIGKLRRSLAIFKNQVFVRGELVFEGEIIGMVV